MLLRYYRSEEGTRVYTLKNMDPAGNQTLSAHPARFTPTDQHSKERIRIKERFGLLPTQKKAPIY
ncbi:H/ACA ribonucleoprotein complex subunit 3 [Rhopalosiphum padi]|uniref:H/ACA ribonucleoprotein complex subunit 3 n=1 Tax=Rhopalosiphum padi TaxID=40932 RepID=UPI00298E695C|nr:H/ACA ribonucleoprotein complex subunit 3 [Rhopalosiphum padi]